MLEQITTYENGKAYASSIEDDLCTIFTLGGLNGSFYESASVAIDKTQIILQYALAKCPELATKYAIYAAETLRMKLMPTIWLVYLSTLNDKTLFKKAFPRIINKNIKLLHDFVNICRNSSIRPGGHMKQRIKNSNTGIGSGVKKVINNYLYEIMNDYNVTRFTGKLEDICHLTRIKDTNEVKKYLDYIFKPKGQERRLTFDRAKYLNEVIQILSNTEDGFPTEAQLNVVSEHIQKYKIQMDEIKFTFGNLSSETLKKVYSYFIPTLSYAALIINLVAIERVWATSIQSVNKTRYTQDVVLETNIPSDIVSIVEKRIKDIKAYRNSGLFFMRLYEASQLVCTAKWRKALSDVFLIAAREAFKDINNIKIRVSADTSGSMTQSVKNLNITPVEIASYFTAACVMSIPNTKAYATATITKEVPLITDNVVLNAEEIMNTNVGYGTNFETLLKGYNGENIVLIITDTQQNGDVEAMWQTLPNKPEGAKFIIWDVVGYLKHNVISKDPTMLYLRGYSDRMISLVSNLILGKAGQKNVVNSITL